MANSNVMYSADSKVSFDPFRGVQDTFKAWMRGIQTLFTFKTSTFTTFVTKGQTVG